MGGGRDIKRAVKAEEDEEESGGVMPAGQRV